MYGGEGDLGDIDATFVDDTDEEEEQERDPWGADNGVEDENEGEEGEEEEEEEEKDTWVDTDADAYGNRACCCGRFNGPFVRQMRAGGFVSGYGVLFDEYRGPFYMFGPIALLLAFSLGLVLAVLNDDSQAVNAATLNLALVVVAFLLPLVFCAFIAIDKYSMLDGVITIGIAGLCLIATVLKAAAAAGVGVEGEDEEFSAVAEQIDEVMQVRMTNYIQYSV